MDLTDPYNDLAKLYFSDTTVHLHIKYWDFLSNLNYMGCWLYFSSLGSGTFN